ncbi:MAG: glucoamylase family protein [Turicibacter sp.]
MKKWLFGIFSILLILVGIVLVNKDSGNYLNKEKELSYQYFENETNWNENSDGYGLVRDRAPGNSNIASIAATGFGLSSIPIAIEEGWITKDEGQKRVEKTLDTLLNLETTEGFFYHFININTGNREWNSEVSNIDTALLIAGALHVGEYFGGVIKEKAVKIYEAVNWNWYVDPDNNQFYMAYTPENGFAGHWDFYAEQLLLYVLGAGSPTYPLDKVVYDSFIRHYGKYGDGEKFIHSWFNSIFTYQFSHAWIDFRNTVDEQGVNWFENSVTASLANYNFCTDLGEKYETFQKGGWGVTASDSPSGYNGLLGASPSGYDNKAHVVDGTIAPAGSIGSIVFTPKESKEALNYYYTMDGLVGDYGLKDAYNLDQDWIANDYIGIDKGITLLMLANHENEAVWDIFMKNEYIQKGLETLSFSKIGE